MLIGKRQWLRTLPRKLRRKILVVNIVGDVCLLSAALYLILNRFTSYRIDPIVFSFMIIIWSSSTLYFQSIYRKTTT